jgi:hypothetical protein
MHHASHLQYAAARTQHALHRQAQRGLSNASIDYVLHYGTPISRAGAIFVTLRRADIPPDDRRDDCWTRLVGTTLVLTDDHVLLTVWRHSQALRKMRAKSKHSRPRRMYEA